MRTGHNAFAPFVSDFPRKRSDFSIGTDLRRYDERAADASNIASLNREPRKFPN